MLAHLAVHFYKTQLSGYETIFENVTLIKPIKILK